MIPLWDLLPATKEYTTARQTLLEYYISMCGGAYKDYITLYKDIFSNDHNKDSVEETTSNFSEKVEMQMILDKLDKDFKEIVILYYYNNFKQDEIDNFRISMIDKDINQEQILLRNKDGVYVLTPVLNQVYTFKGDYPLNSPKPYLYHSYVEAIKGKYDVINNADGYTVTFDTNYDNEPNWSKQEIKFSKDLKPVWSYIYDNENNKIRFW